MLMLYSIYKYKDGDYKAHFIAFVVRLTQFVLDYFKALAKSQSVAKRIYTEYRYRC